MLGCVGVFRSEGEKKKLGITEEERFNVLMN